MNPPSWPLSHTGGTFLLPHMQMVQNNFNANVAMSTAGVHRIITPLSMNSSEQNDRLNISQSTAQQQQQQVSQPPQQGQLDVTNNDRESTHQLLENAHVSYPPLRQISMDLMANWAESDPLQTSQPTQPTQNIPQTTEANFNSAVPTVTSSEALTHIQNQLETELEHEVGKAHHSHMPKRKRNIKPLPETWKKNVRKTKRAKGEAYVSATGKEISAKSIRYVDCSRCRLRCNEVISQEQRDAIFESYWATGSYVRQRDFLCSHVIEEEKARTTVKGEASRRREWTRQYWLPKKSGKLHRVCKSFFLATIDVGCKTIDYALKKRKGGFFCDDDQRGRHEPTNKVTEDKLDAIREHIESFFNMNVSPSKKKKNGRIVLPAEYNIRKMYQMYKSGATEHDHPVQKEHVYRRIFNMEYSITFLEPRKEGVTIRSPSDQATFEANTSQNGPVPINGAVPVVISPEHLNTYNRAKRMGDPPTHQLDPHQLVTKDRHRQPQLTPMKQSDRPPHVAICSSSNNVHQLPSASLQHVINVSSHAMPQYTSAPFMLQSNPPGRPLDGAAAVNMSMSPFPVHPSFIHHHTA